MANFDTGFQAVEGEIFLSSVFHCFLLTRNSGKLLLEEQAVGAQQEVAPTRQQQLFSLVLLRLRPHCYRWRIDDASSSPETPLLRHPNIPQHMVARKKKKKQKTLNSLPLAAAAKIHKRKSKETKTLARFFSNSSSSDLLNPWALIEREVLSKLKKQK
jgi:hypothetical protein